MDANAIFGADDTRVNGDILHNVTEGVIYDNNASYISAVPSDFPVAADPAGFAAIAVTRAQATAFLLLNTYYINQAIPAVSLQNAAFLAYYRFLAVKYGLTSPRYAPNNYNVAYNQCFFVPGANSTCADILGMNDHGVPNAAKANVQAALVNSLTVVNLRHMHSVFVNLVCLLAYMFRTRGHHYLPDMQEKYERLWAKCRASNFDKHGSFEHIMTVSFHFIYPQVLDQYWTHALARGTCDAVIGLRYSAFAAGTSLFNVVDQGIRDLLTVIPKIADVLPNEIEYVHAQTNVLRNNRWAHSVNARLYAADATRLDESRVGVVAALIRSCVEALASDSPILESKSLARAAKLAPIAGAAYTVAIKNYIRSDKFVALGSQ